MNNIIKLPAAIEAATTEERPLTLAERIRRDYQLRIMARRDAQQDAAETVQQDAAQPVEEKPAERVNKFGVKVGDLFTASWGYDQTNVDFFQVIALVGESSVRVREVNPPVLNESATGPMAADYTYQTRGLPILPPQSYSVFIKDQEKGDLKRLKSYAADGKSNPQFRLDTFANAYLCDGNTTTVYESWYA